MALAVLTLQSLSKADLTLKDDLSSIRLLVLSRIHPKVLEDMQNSQDLSCNHSSVTRKIFRRVLLSVDVGCLR